MHVLLHAQLVGLEFRTVRQIIIYLKSTVVVLNYFLETMYEKNWRYNYGHYKRGRLNRGWFYT